MTLPTDDTIVDPIINPKTDLQNDHKGTAIDESDLSAESETWSDDLQNIIQWLKTELEKMTDIAKMAQSNYLRTKMEFDSYQTRTSFQIDDQKLQSLFDVVKKLAPIIDQMKLSLEHITPHMQDDEFTKGIRLVYDNMLKMLESYKIYSLETIWLDLDPELHEPVGMSPIADDNLKGKIVQELSTGYIYKQWDKKTTIIPARVLLWE